MFHISKKITMSVLTIAMFSGCSFKESWSVDKPLEPYGRKDNVVIYEESPKRANKITERDVVLDKEVKRSPYDITKNEVIVEDVYANVRPPKELLREVAPAEFYNKRVGDILRVLTADLAETSLIYEPNVNAGLVVNIKTGKMRLYELLKMVVESTGYYLYYNDKLKSIVVTEMKEMKYYIPAGIFVDRKVDVSLGNTKGDGGGGASGSINLNAENPVQALVKSLDSLGSADKIYSFDKDTGLLVLKEHAIYVPSITQFVFDFVKDRSRKFLVESAIVDVDISSSRDRTLDIAGIVAQTGDFIINGMTNGPGLALTGAFDSASKGTKDRFSVNALVNIINQYNSSELVEQSKIVVANHSVKYMGNLNSIEYVSGVNISETNSNSGRIDIDLKKDVVKDGIQFAARIDGYNKKDYIDISLAPILAYGKLQEAGQKEGIKFYNKTQQVREMLSTATIRSGDIIVVGGLVRDKDGYTSRTDPITEGWTPIGSKARNRQKVETIFIMKVTELTDPSQTFSIPTRNVRSLAEDKIR